MRLIVILEEWQGSRIFLLAQFQISMNWWLL